MTEIKKKNQTGRHETNNARQCAIPARRMLPSDDQYSNHPVMWKITSIVNRSCKFPTLKRCHGQQLSKKRMSGCNYSSLENDQISESEENIAISNSILCGANWRRNDFFMKKEQRVCGWHVHPDLLQYFPTVPFSYFNLTWSTNSMCRLQSFISYSRSVRSRRVFGMIKLGASIFLLFPIVTFAITKR